MLLPLKDLYNKRLSDEYLQEGRDALNKKTKDFWYSWLEMCKYYKLDCESEWKRQRAYLTDLFYRGRGYIRKRPILNDNRKFNGRNKDVLKYGTYKVT